MSSQMTSIIIQLVSLIVLSRLLSPEDFGVIAMISAITALMGLFRDMGLSTAAVQQGDLTYDQTNSLFWINSTAGLTLALLFLALSPVIAWFYRNPYLQPVAALLSCTFLASGLGAQHAALLQRKLLFKQKAIAEISGALLTVMTSILLALDGRGYWAIAWGTVVGAAATTGLYFYLSDFRPSRPRRADGTARLLKFGAHVTGFEIANYFHRNFDNVLIGRVWGAAELGLYSRAYQMMMLPIVSMRTPLNAIAFPILSRLKENPSEFRRYYVQISSLLALLSMPLMAFFTINAEAVVRVVLGESWREVAPIFALLGVCGFIQPVSSLRGLVLVSLGKSRRYLGWGLLNSAAACLAFLIGVSWGATGVAAAYAVVNYLILYPSLKFIFKDTPISIADFNKSIALPALSAMVAAFISFVITTAINPEKAILELLMAGGCFLIVFSLCYLLVPAGRRDVSRYLSLLNTLRVKNNA